MYREERSYMKMIVSKTNSPFSYILTRSEISDKSIGCEYEYVYGISVSDSENMISVEDISPDYTAVKNLFELIYEEQLYPEHLYDVIEDFLS